MKNIYRKTVFQRFYKFQERKSNLEKMLIEQKSKYRKAQREKRIVSKAKAIIMLVTKNTQDQFIRQIETLITTAIRSVFDRNFVFKLREKEHKNRIEFVPVIFEDEHEYIPKTDMGGGIIDIIAFIFRVVLWSVENPQSRNVFVIDEPFKWTGAYIEKAGQMLKRLSEELNFQVILVTHDKELINICDKVWTISHDGNQSNVKLNKRR